MHLKSCLKKVSYTCISVLLLDVHWTNNNGNWVEFSVGLSKWEKEKEREKTVKTLTQQTPRKNSCC